MADHSAYSQTNDSDLKIGEDQKFKIQNLNEKSHKSQKM